MRNSQVGLLALMAFVFSVGCTRDITPKNLTISLKPSSSQGQGAQTVSGNLEFAVVNVHLPTGPVVKQFEFHDAPIPASAGLDVSMDVKGVPSGSTFLVQFLGVYRADGSPSTFAYGDASVTLAGGETPVTITATQIGTFTREGKVVGRYIDRISPESGPTGNLIMQFQPPGGKPKMSLEKWPIVDGWFSIMALDGAAMDYVLAGDTVPTFANVRLNGSTLEILGSAMTPNSMLMKVSTPPTYRRNQRNGTYIVEGNSPTDIYVGYFHKPGLAGTASKTVCYPNSGANEAAPGRYLNSNLTGVVEFDFTGTGGASKISYKGGGLGQQASWINIQNAPGCEAFGTANRIYVPQTLLTTDEDRLAGISAPFQAINPFTRWDNFILSKYNAGTNTIILNWALLPGVTSVSNVAVMAKYSSNGSGGGGGKKTCDDYAREGYLEAGTTASGGVTTFNFTGVGGTSLSAANSYGWSFALCAYKLDAAGLRQYLGRPVSGGNISSASGDGFHMGWAPASATVSGSTSESYTSLGGQFDRVMDITSTASAYTELTLANSSSLQANDEILLDVAASNGSGSCGVYNASPISAGQTTFARVLAVSGSLVKIPKGTFADSMVGLSIPLGAAATAGTNFCRLMAFKVLHFRDLNLSGTSNLSWAGTATAFDLMGTGGGVLPIRVNGLLTLGTTSIDVSFSGFQGGTISNKNGAGVGGAVDATSTTTSGGSGATATGGGGGGGGSGAGASATYPGGQGFSGSYGMTRMVLGGGGGKGGSSGAGGTGGGVAFIVANSISVSSASYLMANGANGASAGDGGGGGGGGSVTLFARSISGGGSLNLSSLGGSGGTGTTAGGVGGGGSIDGLICSGTITGGVAGNAAKGSSGSMPGASDGMVNLYTSANAANSPMSWLCNSD